MIPTEVGYCRGFFHESGNDVVPVFLHQAGSRRLSRRINMPLLKVDGRDIELNEEGFLIHPGEWDEDVARAIGALENITELTEAHWKVLYYLRDYYRHFRISPMFRKLSKDTGISLKEIELLFSSRPAKIACKMAGLPKPSGCL
jgi:tRNA 2-thiouridine synthesizing protein E